MNKRIPHYPLVKQTIVEKEDFIDIELMSIVRKKVDNQYIDCRVLQAWRLTHGTKNRMEFNALLSKLIEFVNLYHIEVAVLLETRDFDVNYKVSTYNNGNDVLYNIFEVSDFQQEQSEYIKSLEPMTASYKLKNQ